MSSVVIALARGEGPRLLRHPVLLAGAVLNVVALVGLSLEEPGHGYLGLAGVACIPLAGATLLVTNLATRRSRGTRSLLDSLPAGERTSSAAMMIAIAYPVALSVTLLGAAYIAMDAGAGLDVTWDGQRATPSIPELAQGPAAVVTLGVLGVALARWSPSTALAPAIVLAWFAAEMFFLRWTPLTASGTRAMWLLPVADPAVTAGLSWPCYGRPAPWCGVERFAVASAGWHLLYLATCAALLASLVLTRRRVRVVGACASLTVLVPAAVIQLP